MTHITKPTVFIIATLSADGFIAPISAPFQGEELERQPERRGSAQPSTIWSSPEDTKWFKQKTIEAGVVIMGRSTWDTIPEKYKPLKNRLNIIYTSSPQHIPEAKKLSEIQNLPATSYQLPAAYTTSLPPKKLIDKLQATSYKLIAVSGGSSIYTQFMSAGVVDKLYLTVEPVIFGQGIPLFDKPINQKLHLDQIIDLSNQTKVLEYSVIK